MSTSGDRQSDARGEVTSLLQAITSGERAKTHELLPIVYAKLRQIAHSVDGAEQPGSTLQPTALVHEAYIRLVHGGPVDYTSRRHFFNVVATAMRRILVDHARSKGRIKRGGDLRRVLMDPDRLISDASEAEFLSIGDALRRFEIEDPRACEVVRLRFYSQLELEEIAQVLNVNIRTVSRDWRAAVAWLQRELREENS